jgi:putative protein kinase ArgK-like GTPase of G3E family
MKDSFGMWSEEMRQIFDSLVDEAYNDLTDNQTKPRNNRAIVLGGLPGAGKSSTLDAMADQGASSRRTTGSSPTRTTSRT